MAWWKIVLIVIYLWFGFSYYRATGHMSPIVKNRFINALIIMLGWLPLLLTALLIPKKTFEKLLEKHKNNQKSAE